MLLKLLNTCIYTVKDRVYKISIYTDQDGQKLKKINPSKSQALFYRGTSETRIKQKLGIQLV